MSDDELILCSFDVPTVIAPNGSFNFPRANKIYQDISRLIKHIRLTPGDKNTSSAQAAKRGAQYEYIHLSS